MTADYAALPDAEMQIVAPGTHFGALMMQQQQQVADARVREEEAKGDRRSQRWCAVGVCIGVLVAAVVAMGIYMALPDEPAVRELVVKTPDTPVRLQFVNGKLVGDVPVQVGWGGEKEAGCVELVYSVGDGEDEMTVQAHNGMVPVEILAAHAGELKVHVRATCNGTGEVAAETPTSYYAFRPDLLVADETCGEVDCALLKAGQFVCDAKLPNASLYQHVLSEKCEVVGSVLSASAVGDGRWAFDVNATGMHTTDDLRQVFAAGRFVIDTHAEPEGPAPTAAGAGAGAGAGAARSADVEQLSRTFSKEFDEKLELPLTWLTNGSTAAVGVHGKVEVRAVLTVVFPCESWFNIECYKAEGIEVSVTSPLDAHAYMKLVLAEGTIPGVGGRLAKVPVFKKGPAAVDVHLYGHIGGAVMRAGEVGLEVDLGGDLELAYDTKSNDLDTRLEPKVTYKMSSLDDLPTIGVEVGLTPKLVLGFGLLKWTFTVGVGFPVELQGTAHLSERRCELAWGVDCQPELGWDNQPALLTKRLSLYQQEIYNGRCPGM